jgi:hypothetical protein
LRGSLTCESEALQFSLIEVSPRSARFDAENPLY